MTVQAPLASLRNCLAAQPHGHLLACVQEPGTVALSNRRHPDAKDLKLPTTPGDAYRASACAWSSCGRFLLTSWQGAMGMLTMHEVDEALHVQQVACGELFFWPKDMAVASQGEGLLVALAGAPGVVLYRLEKDYSKSGPGAWRMSQRARLCPMWTVCAVSLSADGATLAAAALGSQLHVWDLAPGLHAIRLELQVQIPAERVTAVAFPPDGSCLAAITWAGCIFLYSRRHSRQRLTELAAFVGETDSQAAGTSEERPHGQDNPALSTEVFPGIPQAGPDETTSRLAWIEHGAKGDAGWSLTCSHPTDAPLKPQVSCTSLLAWLDDSRLVVSVQGCLAVFVRCGERLRLARNLSGGGSEGHQEGGERSAGEPGIRGLALQRSPQGTRPDSMACVLVCDSLGRVRCHEAGHVLCKE